MNDLIIMFIQIRNKSMFHYPITITIDTNIFDTMKYDLSKDSKLRVLLKHVNDGKVKIVLRCL